MSLPKTFVTFGSLARRTGIAPASLSRRIRALGIAPDAITVETSRPSVMLFATKRLPTLRRALISTEKEAVL